MPGNVSFATDHAYLDIYANKWVCYSVILLSIMNYVIFGMLVSSDLLGSIDMVTFLLLQML